MGDIVSIGDALIITLFSMVVVFAGLVALSFCISILKNISREKKPETEEEPAAKDTDNTPARETEEVEKTNDEELIAVIASAIAANLGLSIPEIKIKSIRRTSQNPTAWAAASRQEQMYNKL